MKYSDIETTITQTLDKYAPLKTKFLRANNRPHVTKELRKAIMVRSKLKNLAIKSNNCQDWEKYRKQRNLVVWENRKAKISFFNSVNLKSGKRFWETCKPFFPINQLRKMKGYICLKRII